MTRGDTRVINITYTSSGSPLDITGSTVYFTARDKLDDATDDSSADISKSQTSHSDPANGVTSITLVPSDTSSLAVGTYVYDVQLVQSDGTTTSTDVGSLVIKNDVTKS